MKFPHIFLLLSLSWQVSGQTLFDAQQSYDDPGGLYDPDSLRSIDLDFYDPGYHSALVDSFWSDPDFRLLGDVSLNGQTLNAVGMRYKGNSTFCGPWLWGVPKFPFNLDMNYIVSGQKLMDYKKIKLSNAWSDATFSREYAASTLYRRYLPTYEVNAMKVHVQGDLVGLYTNTESINKQFLEKHFGEKDGVLIKCDADMTACIQYTGVPNLEWLGVDTALYYPHYEVKSDQGGWTDLKDLIHTLRFDPAGLDSVLNIDRALWYFALNTCLLNLDSYNGVFIHNYYLYKTQDGLFQMIPWDISETFIGNTLGHIGGDSVGYSMDPYNAGFSKPLLDSLLAVELYRDQYTAHIRTIIEESMDSLELRTSINHFQDIIESAALSDTNKIHNNISFRATVDSSYNGNSGGIMSTLEGRRDWLMAHPEISLTPPDILNVVSVNGVLNAEVFNANSVELMLSTNGWASKFEAYSMHDDGLGADLIAGDGIWSVAFPQLSNGTSIQYYIRGRNADAMQLSPQRAEYEFYEEQITVNVEEVLPLRPIGKILWRTDALGRVVNVNTKGVQFLHYENGAVAKVLRFEE